MNEPTDARTYGRLVRVFPTDAGAWLASARVAANGGPEVEVERHGRGFAVVTVWDGEAEAARAILRQFEEVTR